MKIKELDVVLLKDGRKGAVIEVFNGGEAYMIDISDEEGHVLETPIVKLDEIQKITYTA